MSAATLSRWTPTGHPTPSYRVRVDGTLIGTVTRGTVEGVRLWRAFLAAEHRYEPIGDFRTRADAATALVSKCGSLPPKEGS